MIFLMGESETIALQILEWISISKLVVETVWTVVSPGSFNYCSMTSLGVLGLV